MRPLIVYPVPYDSWDPFAPYVQRFAATFKSFPPGVEDYELAVVSCWGEPTEDLKLLFRGTHAHFVTYHGSGCDIGAAQWFAFEHGHAEQFYVCCTSRCYFHREGYLRRIVEAREKYGPGLYGAFASWESGKPHICTRFYGLDYADLRNYPHQIDTRAKGQLFETGEWSVSDWMGQQGKPLIQVLWDNEQTLKDWRKWDGAFRYGEQQACLVWDKHTDIYRDAEPEERARLKAMADVPNYSQHDEDHWIVTHLDLPAQGTFCEVGAHDGVTGSNTLLFERMGWKGVCCEAVEELAQACNRNRKCEVFSGAVGNETRDRIFHVNHEDLGLSGFDRPGDPILVKQTRLADILTAKGFSDLDLLSIDTEGSELSVWNSIGQMRPRILILEHKTCDLPTARLEIRLSIEPQGYGLVHETEHNLIFVRQ